MSSIFSTQNLQTFLRRKNLRPPAPPSRGGPPGPRPPPPNLGRSPPGLPPSLRGLSATAACSGAFVSSAITLLFNRRNLWRRSILCHSERSEESAVARRRHKARKDHGLYAVAGA